VAEQSHEFSLYDLSIVNTNSCFVKPATLALIDDTDTPLHVQDKENIGLLPLSSHISPTTIPSMYRSVTLVDTEGYHSEMSFNVFY